MQLIFKFLKKYKYFLLFLLLQFIAFTFTIQSHSYHRSKFINSANSITGGIYKQTNSINEFFSLRDDNTRLLEENTRLKNLLSLELVEIPDFSESIDSTKYFQRYKYTSAKIHKNSFSKRNNYLMINKGSSNGIIPEMAVVNGDGIIGITKSVSKHNATVISILNSYSKINVKLKNSNHFGTLYWNGESYKTIQLLDLPRQATIKVGDTIITGGKSTIFPEGILVGKISDFELSNAIYKTINIELFNDMSSLSNVTIIGNLQKQEIEQLESQNDE